MTGVHSAPVCFLPINGNVPETEQSRKMDKVVDLSNSAVFHFFHHNASFLSFLCDDRG